MIMWRGFLTLFFLGWSQGGLAIDLQSVLNSVSSNQNKSASFTETRTAYYLETPLISKGSLEFRGPQTMIKYLTQPEKIEQRIEGDILEIYQDGNIKKSISLISNTEIAVSINAIRWVLSGNLAALRENFVVKFNYNTNTNANTWALALVPVDPELVADVASILVAGKDNRINQIEIKQSNGDSIRTVLYDHR